MNEIDYNKLVGIAHRIITDNPRKPGYKKLWIDDINIIDAFFLIQAKRSILSTTKRKVITKACREFSKVFYPIIHELKTHSEHFIPLKTGVKRMEFRINDRGYKVGHILMLFEWGTVIQDYTGDVMVAQITHILDNNSYPFFDLHDFVIMSLKF